MQLESYRQSLMDLIFQDPENHSNQNTPKISPAIHIKAIDSLHKITLSLAGLEKMLPLVTRFSKDMDIEELLKLNNAYNNEIISASNQGTGPQETINLRPQYMEIEEMINSVLQNHQRERKSNDISVDAEEAVPNENYPFKFRAVL
jgi:hypothetical protein